MSEHELASIKKPGESEVISNAEFEHRIREIAKCKRDIVYFAEKYFKIINLDTGLTTIKLYPKQKELLRYFTGEKRCIVLASRQSSKTTTYTIYALWLLMFHAEKKVMLLANKADTALEILGRIRMAYEYCPSFLKPAVAVWNKGEIVFSNMSAIKAFATASDAARGWSCNAVIMDEAAFVPNNIASKVFESIYPVISSSKNSQFIMVSTPNGADNKNLYYDIWCKANSKAADKNTEGWKPFRFDWWDVPGRDEQWKKNTIASIGQQRFDQEFGNVFMTSSSMRKLIPDDIIEKYRIKLSEYKTKGIESKKQKILSDKEDELYEFDMWHEFQANRTYVASGDISEGVGGDSSVLYVWDVTDLSNIIMCAKFASNTISLVQFAYVCSKILALYNNPFLFAERNGVSAGMLDSLKITYGYQNIASENKKNEPGIYSHVQVKGKACLWTRDMMTTKGFGFTIYDKDLLDEIGIFVKKDTKGLHNVYHAAPGPNSHDDHMLAFVWACYCLQNEIIEKYFVVCETFTDDLGQIKPKILAPLTAYRVEDISKVRNDPIYKQFLEFKNELNLKLKQAMELEKKDIQSDIFKYKRYDAYFGEYVDEDTWNNMPLNWNMRQQNGGNQTNLNPSVIRPSFFIL